MKLRRIEITIESESVVLAGSSGAAQAWCAGCGVTVPVLSAREAAAVAGGQEVLCTALRQRAIHAAGDGPQVCMPSLLRFVLTLHPALPTDNNY